RESCKLVCDNGACTDPPVVRARFCCSACTLLHTCTCALLWAASRSLRLGNCSVEVWNDVLISLPRGKERPSSTHSAPIGTFLVFAEISMSSGSVRSWLPPLTISPA